MYKLRACLRGALRRRAPTRAWSAPGPPPPAGPRPRPGHLRRPGRHRTSSHLGPAQHRAVLVGRASDRPRGRAELRIGRRARATQPAPLPEAARLPAAAHPPAQQSGTRRPQLTLRVALPQRCLQGIQQRRFGVRVAEGPLQQAET